MFNSDQVVLLSLSRGELRELVQTAVSEAISKEKREEKDLIDTKGMMDWLNISLSTLNKWKASNKVPYKRMGRKIFFSKSDVLRALEESNYHRLKELTS